MKGLAIVFFFKRHTFGQIFTFKEGYLLAVSITKKNCLNGPLFVSYLTLVETKPREDRVRVATMCRPANSFWGLVKRQALVRNEYSPLAVL